MLLLEYSITYPKKHLVLKKILFILHLPPPVHGSAVVGQNIKNSRAVNESFDCNYVNLNTSHSIDEIGKNPFIKISRYIKIVFQILKHLITNKPYLCYLAITAKGMGFYKDAMIALLVKLFNVKLVFHFHNKGVYSQQHKKINHFFYNMVFRNTDAIILSRLLYSDIERYFSLDRVYICPNGIEYSEIANSAYINEKNIYSSELKNELLFVSNLIESKGVLLLLDACKIIKDKNLSFHCTLIGAEGDVSAEQLQKKIIELELDEHVTYVGRKYGKEKETFFANSTIFVFPTYYHNETFGLVNVEAMQHYLPVISTFEGGIPDVIENGVTGILVPQKNVNALADAIETLINNPQLRASMGKAGRKKYEQEFTMAKFEESLINTLNQITSIT